MSRESLAQMVGALAKEIRAVRDRRGRTELTVLDGRFCGRSGELYLYAFRLDEERVLREDSPVQVRVGDEQLDGMLVSWQDNELVIGVSVDLGERVDHARLVTDDAFLLERLHEVLTDILRGRASDFSELKASQAIGDAPARSSDAAPTASVLSGEHPLNDAQQRAVGRALGSEVTYIWGPPGTGKTTVLARIVEALYLAGHRVLVVSNMNVAVDTLLEKIADRLAAQGDAGLLAGRVLRLGALVKDELRDRHGEHVDLERVVERLSAGLAAERDRLQARLQELQQEEERLSAALSIHERHLKLQEHAHAASRRLAAVREREQMLTTAAGDATARIDDLLSAVERAERMNAVVRFLHGLKPERMRAELSLLQSQRSQAIVALDQLRGEIPPLQAEVTQRRDSLHELADQVRDLPPHQQCVAELQESRGSIARAQQRLKQIEEQLAQVQERLVRECAVLATTVYQVYLRAEIKGLFDVVVIDEASMLTPPLVYYAAGRARSRVIVAGDFRQLPPIVVTRDEEALAWLKTDVFALAGIKDAVQSGRRPASLVSLSVQYRMRQALCGLVSSFFYEPDNHLEAHASVKEESAHALLGEGALCYVDTSRWQPWAAYEASAGGCYNIIHALVASEIMAVLGESGAAASGQLDLALMTQFRAQRQLMNALLQDQRREAPCRLASTVHAFQGNEKGAVVLELTQSQGLGRPWGWITAKSRDDEGARLLNVALSRARHNVILVANFQYLSAKLPRTAIARQVLDYFVEHGTELPGEWFYPKSVPTDIARLRPDAGSGFPLDDAVVTAFDEKTFYPAFIRDLGGAEQFIVIFSPYLTEVRTATLVDLLRERVGCGILVRVVTELGEGLWAAETREGIDALRGCGLTVDTRRKMHEKIAIIDGAVLWHGSLNILSHSGKTTESMLRIPGEEACMALAMSVSTPRVQAQLRVGDWSGFTQAENPPCPKCGSTTTLVRGRRGVFFSCNGCRETVDVRAASRLLREDDEEETPEECPKCGRPLIRKTGRYGPFLGCTGYPECRFNRSL